MSALGQKRTSRRILVMSALPPKADIAEDAPKISVLVSRFSEFGAILLFDQNLCWGDLSLNFG
jgi:hypothetical protein